MSVPLRSAIGPDSATPDGAGLLDASRILGTSNDGETVARALELVLQVGEALQGLTLPFGARRDAWAGDAEAAHGHSAGYRERLLDRLPRWTCAGVPIRTALAAGSIDALLAEVTMLHLLLERREVELASRAREAECHVDEVLCARQRIRVLEERVEELERACAGLRAELRGDRTRRSHREGRHARAVTAMDEMEEAGEHRPGSSGATPDAR